LSSGVRGLRSQSASSRAMPGSARRSAEGEKARKDTSPSYTPAIGKRSLSRTICAWPSPKRPQRNDIFWFDVVYSEASSCPRRARFHKLMDAYVHAVIFAANQRTTNRSIFQRIVQPRQRARHSNFWYQVHLNLNRPAIQQYRLSFSQKEPTAEGFRYSHQVDLPANREAHWGCRKSKKRSV